MTKDDKEQLDKLFDPTKYTNAELNDRAIKMNRCLDIMLEIMENVYNRQKAKGMIPDENE
jgi:hypothetical protein